MNFNPCGRPQTLITKIHKDAVFPSYGTEQSAGIDLCICEDVIIYPGQVKLVRTGLVIKPPMGYYYELCLRSSTPIKNPGIVLANGIGVIDADYCGLADEIKIPLLNTNTRTSRRAIEFKKGDRIAQLVLRELHQPSLVDVTNESVNVWGRGFSRGGFGSTG
jgi:dUTP pyrophosphatase